MFYKSLSISKQAVHQWVDRRLQQAEQRGYLLPLIAQLRQDHPTLSCRAMYAKLQPQAIGREPFEQLCKNHGFSMQRKLNLCRTTDSTGVVRFDNLLEHLALSRINEAWSSDITYYEVASVFTISPLSWIVFPEESWAIQSVAGLPPSIPPCRHYSRQLE